MKSCIHCPSEQGCRPSFVVPPSPRGLPPSLKELRRTSRRVGRRLASGFTLIELLVVIVVIAILMGITLPLSKYAVGRANEARQKVMLAKIRSALDEYRATYGEYPITPPAPRADVLRHYPQNYTTYDFVESNCPSTNVTFDGTNTLETIRDIDGNPVGQIDYCLTYPLMLKQLDKGARPFMEFPLVGVVKMVNTEKDVYKRYVTRRTKGGGTKSKLIVSIYGDLVKRNKAIDPVTGQQWRYECVDGINYVLK
ncbi:MAG: type II secretion system protein [Kiritimatiellae bacterium]|nr:type II secretion system protein [Kiritimatiellia bacterium]